MNIVDLQFEVEWLEDWRGMSRVKIDPREQHPGVADTEWFCLRCGELVEDEFEGCPVCG